MSASLIGHSGPSTFRLPHHFPLDPSDFFDEMCAALQDGDIKRLEMIGFRQVHARIPDVCGSGNAPDQG